jgi:predicted NUDIX family NTP pyrophosphohydrolase
MTHHNNDRPQVWRAGGIPYTIDESGIVNMLFMVPATTEFNKANPDLKLPQIAKGRVERFEQPLPAAIRECAEELGLVEGNIEATIEGGVVLGRTHIYAFKVVDAAPTAFTEFSSETESVVWMTYDQFMMEGRELHKPVVDMLHSKILEHYFNELMDATS